MRPREYSIASYRKEEVGILCALVDYRTIFNRHIQGLCSRYLSEAETGSLIKASFSKGLLGFPMDATTPVIMVGPGTGVAPFISYLEYRTTLT